MDPYANAFNYDSTGHADSHKSDSTTKPDYLDSKTNAMINEIFERKYEIDSLAAMLKLSYAYYINTKDLSPFDSDWIDAVNNIIEVIKDMQKETTPGVRFNYFFQRESTQPTESLQNGFGFPGKKTNLVYIYILLIFINSLEVVLDLLMMLVHFHTLFLVMQ